MNENELKTSPKQRFFIILIAVIMLGSIIASYIAIVINGGKSTATGGSESQIDTTKIAEYESIYNQKQAEFSEKTKDSFDKFIKYKSEIVAYNETSANENGVQVRDLKIGSGRELTEGDYNYLAYYVGWCADETIFDSSFNDDKNPTAFARVLDASLGMIEGWNLGVEGMNIGGIREITVPGNLAYGEAMEICGGLNKPLKFIVMAVANEDPLKSLANELDEAYMRVQYAYYGIDYDEMIKNSN